MLKLNYWLVGGNAIAVFVVGAARLGWPDATFWGRHQLATLVALGATALVPLAQLVVAQTSERSRLKQIERQREVETCLTASLVYCVKHAGAGWLDIGIQVFEVKRAWWRRNERQVRLAKVRLRAVSVSGVDWVKGKGVIGRCWETHAPQYEDLQALFAAYDGHNQPDWDALPAAERFGLSFGDFQRLKGKYGIVAAVPIMDSHDRYIGCVAADTAPTNGNGQPLQKDEILASLVSTAQIVAGVIKR